MTNDQWNHEISCQKQKRRIRNTSSSIMKFKIKEFNSNDGSSQWTTLLCRSLTCKTNLVLKTLTLVFIVWTNINNTSKVNSNFCVLKYLTVAKGKLLYYKKLQEIL